MSETLTDLLDIGRQKRLPVALLEEMEFDESLLSLIKPELAREHRVIPIGKCQDRIFLACVGGATEAEDYFSRLLDCDIIPVLVSRESMQWGIEKYYAETAQELQAKASESVSRYVQEDKGKTDATTPVARLVTHALLQAIRTRASDIHLEPFQGRSRMRFRIDGVLIDQGEIPGRLYDAVVSRIKILAKLDIAEKRRPQDGRASFDLDGQEVDLRVSVMPALDGEGVVIRLLGGNKAPLKLDALGFSPALKKNWLRIAQGSNGIILVTGPTGSGKTTTLYGTLKEILTPEKKVLTLEEPVEARLEGVLQIPIRSELGFSFHSGLRSALRHDPDIMLVGEIRDKESAEIAVAASLTGHLLFATLHTNSAAQAVTRLLDMGLQEYQVMTALRGVLAQRLMRRLCSHCRSPVKPEMSGLNWESFTGQRPEVVYQAVGCEQCNGIGFRGRIPVFELLEITTKMRRLRGAELDAHRLSELCSHREFGSLSQSAMSRVANGESSASEYFNLVGGE